MAGKIFINYRRDDAKAEAARLRDRLAQAFGSENVFMDVDNLLAGERFDVKLEEALADTDVFLAVIGARWLDLLEARAASGKRDFVCQEIAAALARKIAVIPVLMDRAPLPRREDLPGDIGDLVLYHKHDIVHESFGRDATALIEAIKAGRRARRKPVAVPWKPIAAVLAVAATAALLIAQPWPHTPSPPIPEPKHAEPVKPEPAPPARQAVTQEDRYRAEGRIAIDAAIVNNAQGRWFLPGAGKTESFKDCPDCPEMVVAPAGSFMMGSPASEPERYDDEGPQHRVTIPKPFAVGRFAVTFAEWDACVADSGCGGYKPSDQGWGRDDRPVINVSWNDAQAYVAWLKKKTGKTYRLLTESEREYAARAGTTTPFWWGKSITPDQANYKGTYAYAGGGEKGAYREKTVPVKSFDPNPWGLYQVHGNVWEWVEDCWRANYDGALTDGSAKTTGDCASRVLRGGSWVYGPRVLRAARRDWFNSEVRVNNLGFRVARTF